MEKITEEQFQGVLARLRTGSTETGAQLQRRLPHEELTALGILLERTARRYPNQDLSETLPEYMADLEQLSLKYSLQAVEDAIAKLRVDPEQDFFPTPTDVAAEMKRQRMRKVPSDVYARG